MGEQIPCPVCTLFLHPGMNLADHLETHPKEQVIKALVSLASRTHSIRPQTPTALIAQHNLPSIENSSNTSLLTSSESKVGFMAPHNRNVMIVNRQSTLVYQDTGHQRMCSQAIPIAPPPLQVFNVQQQGSPKFLPPPPAYGTALHQIRSQSNPSPNGCLNQQTNYENPYYGISNHNNLEMGISRHSSPRLPSRNSSPRPTPSPSVLRYAESPITAHYVERENGDFIVQETPRHVVECVEKDDGEFSVIEKVIKSPPSVVQIQENDSVDNMEYNSNENSNIGANDDDDNISDIDIHNTQKSLAASVKVLSNVKLAPKESLDLMENIMASNTPGVQLLRSSLAEPISEVIKMEKFEKTWENSDQDDFKKENYEQNVESDSVIKSEFDKLQSSSCAATSVIRLATIQKNTSLESQEKSPAFEHLKSPPKPGYSREAVKRPFKKAPKKLVVKFKNPPRLENDNANAEEPQPGPSDNQLNKQNPEISVQDKAEVPYAEKLEALPDCKDLTEESSNNISVEEKCKTDLVESIQSQSREEEELFTIAHQNEMSLGNKEPGCVELEQLEPNSLEDDTKEKILETNENNALDMELETASMPIVIVHEPSLMQEPSFENNEDRKPEHNSETDKKDVEFSKLLVECMDNNPPESYTIHLSTIDSIPENITDSSLMHTNCGTENNESDSEKNESTTLNSFPSTSFSKPSGSSFALRDQTDFHTSHSYNDYPFSFLYANNLDKNCLSPIYPSDEQSWHRIGGSAFQQHGQIQVPDFDGERSSYIDLDACKKHSSTDTLPLVDTLNIQTDEKMPAKGEISEQESNGEIDLSWSQTLYNESQRFHNNQLENYGTREIGSYSNEGFFFYPQNLNSEEKMSRSPQQSSSVEKQEPLESKEKEKKNSTVRKKKTFQCDHCLSVFIKLKERNTHLLEKHNYKRINRRLVREHPPATITTSQVQELQNTDGTEIFDVKKTEITAISSADSSHLPRTKYDSIRAGVYRMLMNFNLSVLQENKNIEEDKSLFDSKSFCCYTCKRDFISVKSFDEHLTEHPAECFTCSKKFTRWTYFSIHLKRHLGWKDFGCTVCSKKFVIRSALIEHMRMHTGVTPLKCKFCDKHFKRYSNLTQHKRVCHQTRNSKKKDYVCHCGEVLPSKARFLWHKETHDTKPKCCPYCRDRFVHSNSLRRHIRLAHSDKFSYTEPTECPVCNQVYAKTSLKAHMSTHSMDTQHECIICNKSFSTKWNLKIHSWVHANRTSKPFKCDLCVKAFVREVDYKNHINAHKQIKPYTCEYCGCKFIRKYNYMRHRREHHGQKKFGCDLCGKLFHRHYYLIEHRRTHTGERPFLCTICGKSSTTKTNHNKHLKIHHSRDPFTTET